MFYVLSEEYETREAADSVTNILHSDALLDDDRLFLSWCSIANSVLSFLLSVA